MIIRLNNSQMVWKCMCGHTSTYNFNYGGVNTKNAPFALNNGDTLSYRIDNNAGNDGYVENITFSVSDFPNMQNITSAQLSAALSSKLVYANAFVDNGNVLVQSKTSGVHSSVEVIDGMARAALGYDLRGGDGIEHYCCARLFMGYKMYEGNNNEDAILLRACPACTMTTTLVRNHVDYSNQMPHAATLHRRAVNSLAIYMIKNGWVDYDLVDYYANENYAPTEILDGFPDSEVILPQS